MRLKGMISGRGQGLLRSNHFMQLFTITCKQTAGIVVAINNLQNLGITHKEQLLDKQ